MIDEFYLMRLSIFGHLFFKHSDHFGFYLLFVTLMYKKAWTTNSQALHVYSQGFFGLSVTPSVYDIS